MGTVLHLPPPPISAETVALFRTQLVSALRGEAIGAVVVVYYAGHHFAVGATGIAKSDPIWARGTLCKVDDELAKLVADNDSA